MKRILAMAAALVIGFQAVGCDDDDTPAGDTAAGDDTAADEPADEASDNGRAVGGAPGDGGEASVTATGAVQGEFEGHAVFTQASLDGGTFSVDMTDNSEFGLELRIEVDDGAVPAPATFEVGSGFSDESFYAAFRDFTDGGMVDPDEYISTGEGTVELVDTSDDAASGSFEVELSAHGGDSDDTVEVSGEFRAVQVEGGDSL